MIDGISHFVITLIEKGSVPGVANSSTIGWGEILFTPRKLSVKFFFSLRGIDTHVFSKVYSPS